MSSPYNAPQSNLEPNHEKSDEKLSVQSCHWTVGWRWFKHSLALVIHAPGPYMLATLSWLGISFACNIFGLIDPTVVISMVLNYIVGIGLSVGFLLFGLAILRGNSQQLSISQLCEPLTSRHNALLGSTMLSFLVMIAIMISSMIAIVATFVPTMGALESSNLQKATTALDVINLVGFGTMAALVIVMTFALIAAQVMYMAAIFGCYLSQYHNYGIVDGLTTSIKACLKNTGAILTLWMSLSLAFLPCIALAGMAFWAFSSSNSGLTILFFLSALVAGFFATPVYFASIAIGFRGIFTDDSKTTRKTETPTSGFEV